MGVGYVAKTIFNKNNLVEEKYFVSSVGEMFYKCYTENVDHGSPQSQNHLWYLTGKNPILKNIQKT